MKITPLPLLLLLPAATPAARAELRLHPLFGDHALLQSKSDAPVRGWADPGATVTVKASWGADSASATADAAGRWTATLKTPDAGGPFELTVESAGQKVVSTDLLTGEVWLCGGQSNMQFGLRGSDGGAEEVAAANLPKIRLFHIPQRPSGTPLESADASWKVCSPETAGGFSAVAFFFAQKIQAETGLPVGLIGSYWGGTRVEPWIDEGTLLKRAEYAPLLDSLNQARASSNGKTADQLAAEHRQHMQELLAAADPGFSARWNAPEVDPAGWQTTPGPVAFEKIGAGTFDGVVWCRKTLVLPEDLQGKGGRLVLGAIDDRDITWINGVEVGATLVDGKFNQSRQYPVPGGVLKAGTNVVTVLILDTSGAGGMSWQGVEPRLDCAGRKFPLTGDWLARTGVALSGMPGLPVEVPGVTRETPAALYMGMIHPAAGFPLRGFLWYQGESNVGNWAEYARRFPDLIQSWRNVWNNTDLPFYFVQIAPYHYNGGNKSQFLRDVQRQALAVPNTGMAVTTDIGNPRDIHPTNKRDVGERLARWALRDQYGKTGLTVSGPLYDSMRVEGGAIRIRFKHTDGGLAARGGPLTDFQIAGRDRVFKPAEASIDGDSLRVYNPEIAAPVAVRFGWKDDSVPNLFNGAGLPASPFRTDDWPE
ncbi:MAG: sialate O-acetylesterase [Kiritimatiellia bacterium]